MKETKFKVYLKKEEEYDIVDLIDFKNKVIKTDTNKAAKFEDAVLLSFTELQDKNGIDIFEEDILKVYKEDGSKYFCKVFFDHFDKSFKKSDAAGNVTELRSDLTDTYEVVGNMAASIAMIAKNLENNE